MREIVLTQGKNAIVDDADFDWLSQWNWCCRSDGYATRGRRYSEYPGTRCVRMHRQILGVDDRRVVDHINGNTLDNRRENLRICTQSENTKNSSGHSDSDIGLKGVSRKRNKFRARICVSGKTVNLGSFPTPEEAYTAYCEAAKRLNGEFARF